METNEERLEQELDNANWILFDKDLEIDDLNQKISMLQRKLIDYKAKLILINMTDLEIETRHREKAIDALMDDFQEFEWI